MAVPKFQISDLLARYSLEPTLRDVFVEGRFDKDILAACARKSGASDIIVYEIDCVDVPSELLRSFGLTTGNRQRVISLAGTLAAGVTSGSYRCVADKDLDHWFGELVSVRGLRWTDHSSIDLYFLEEELVREILVHSARATVNDWSAFYASFLEVLQSLYALRLTAKQLNLTPNWLTFDRCLSETEGVIRLDLRDYTTRLLMGIGRAARIDDVMALIDDWRGVSQSSTLGNRVRGQDFVDLLAWAIRKYHGTREMAESGVLRRILVLLTDRVPTLNGLLSG